MPIYEFACPKCRRIFSFLSKRVNPGRLPVCPRCGGRKMIRQMSRFAMTRGLAEPTSADPGEGPMPDFNDPRVAHAMGEIERQIEHLDEGNPRQMAHLMRQMKEILPEGSLPRDVDVAIQRLEAGEDPEKIEEDMGDVFGELMGGGTEGGAGAAPYTQDSGLYDY